MTTSSSPDRSLLCPTLVFLCSALAATLLAASASAATISWLNAANGFWNEGSNWDGGVVPGSGDTASITLPQPIGGYGVTVNADADVGAVILGSGDDGGKLEVTGSTFQIVGPATSTFDSGLFISANSGSTVRFQGPVNVTSAFDFEGSSGTFFNEDTLTLDGGAAAIYNFDRTFDNSGTMIVNSGQAFVSSPFTTSGPVTVATGAELEFDIDGVTHTLAQGGSFDGGGIVTVVGSVSLDVTATTPPTLGGGLTFDLFGSLDGSSLVNDGTFHWNGDVMGTGELRNRGLMVANGDLSTRTLANESTLEIDDLGLFDNAVVDNESGGLLELADTGVGGSGSVINAGTLRKASGAGTGFVSVPLTSTGTVEALSGTLDLSDFTQTAGTTTVNATLSSSSTLDVQGGVLEGTGTVAAVVDLGGTVSAGDGGVGTLACQSNLNFGAGARLLAEIGGTAAGSGYDQVTVAGTASLDGTLELVLINSFEPSLGDSFVVLSGSTTGSFASLDLPPLTPGLKWQVTTDPVSATVVDDPSLIFADSFESGDVDAWSSFSSLLGGQVEAPDAEHFVVTWRPDLAETRRVKALSQQSTIVSARGAQNSEIFALDSRRRQGTLEVRLRAIAAAGAAEQRVSTEWLEVAREAEITVRYRPALADLGDGAVFLDVEGRLEAWLTDLPVSHSLDQIRYDDRLLSVSASTEFR